MKSKKTRASEEFCKKINTYFTYEFYSLVINFFKILAITATLYLGDIND